jgi:hypothetical protein
MLPRRTTSGMRYVALEIASGTIRNWVRLPAVASGLPPRGRLADHVRYRHPALVRHQEAPNAAFDVIPGAPAVNDAASKSRAVDKPLVGPGRYPAHARPERHGAGSQGVAAIRGPPTVGLVLAPLERRKDCFIGKLARCAIAVFIHPFIRPPPKGEGGRPDELSSSRRHYPMKLPDDSMTCVALIERSVGAIDLDPSLEFDDQARRPRRAFRRKTRAPARRPIGSTSYSTRSCPV